MEEFDNEGVDDSDLLAAIHKSTNEQVVEDIDDIMTEVDAKKHTRKRSLTMSSGEENERFREPQKLANGKWTCQHTCRDEGKECKHKCCIQGVKKKPKNKKQKTDKSATLSDAGNRTKAVKKDVKKQPKYSGTLPKMWSRPDNDSTKEPTARESMAQSVAKTDPPSNHVNCHKDASISSGTAGESPQPSHNFPHPDQIFDALNLADFDWQAVDEIDAAVDWNSIDFKSIETESGLDEHKTVGKAHDSEDAEFNLPKQTMLTPRYESDGFLFPYTSSPCKQAAFQHDSELSEILGGNEPRVASRKNGSSAELDFPNPICGIVQSQEKGLSKFSTVEAQSPKVVEKETASHVNKIEETEYERAQRLEEEDQKRRWAELASDRFTYETFGKYIRLVDDVE